MIYSRVALPFYRPKIARKKRSFEPDRLYPQFLAHAGLFKASSTRTDGKILKHVGPVGGGLYCAPVLQIPECCTLFVRKHGRQVQYASRVVHRT